MKAHFWPILFAAVLCLPACSEPTPQGHEGSPDDVKNQFSLHEFTISENTEQGKKLKELTEGKPVDLDNDGSTWEMTIDEEGVIHLSATTMEGNVRFYFERHPDGREHELHDANLDGNTDIQEDVTIEEKPIFRKQRVRLVDRDFDGYPEERTTVITDHGKALETVIEERDDEGKGNYVITKQWSREIYVLENLEKETTSLKNIEKNSARSGQKNYRMRQ